MLENVNNFNIISNKIHNQRDYKHKKSNSELQSISSETKANNHKKLNLTANMPAIPEIIVSSDLTKVIKILKSQIENNNGLDKLINQSSRDHKLQTQRKEMFNSNLMITNELKSRTKQFLNFKKEQDKT